MRAGRQDVDLYGTLIEKLGQYGEVLTPFVADKRITLLVSMPDRYIHDWDLELLEQSDVVVAEDTQPSLGVSYEIGRAVSMKKPILCLFRRKEEGGKFLSRMIRGMNNDADLRALDYSLDMVDAIFEDFMAQDFAKPKTSL